MSFNEQATPIMNIGIDKGLDIPVTGAPEQRIDEGRRTESVALLGRDHLGHRPVLKVGDGDRVRTGQTLLNNQISGAPVLDESGNLVGILSKKECLKVAFSDSYYQNVGGQVSDYMSVDVETVDAGTSIIDMAEQFLGGTYHRFPVIRNGRLAGLISRHDILKAIEEQW